MKPADILEYPSPEQLMVDVMNRLHSEGPIMQEDLQILSYIKFFFPDIFKEKENKLMYLLGLFYKANEPEDLLSFSYTTFANSILEETGYSFTPVQASLRSKVLLNRYFSFSAPTSAGKSFLFRELIKSETGDIVIVVPSRALIAEYMLAVRDIVADKKEILVLQFIEDVNKKNTSRRVFVVTPERAAEIFKLSHHFNPTLFLYDEAQISEERVRGTTFDAFVRRSDRIFPMAKKVFAHPFVENPDAQLKKHDFVESADSTTYKQSVVGKIYLAYDNKTDSFQGFSPFIDQSHLKKNKVVFSGDIVKDVIESGGSLLAYVSKESIYDKSFEEDFEKYISLCKKVEDPRALAIIEEVEELIGAKDRNSEMMDLMRRGIVVHHGSVPLNVRFLVERFTNAGFARICFATSTLIQGVNMPFDIVWIENVRFTGTDEDKTLGLRNLIGRAGRMTSVKSQFDFGFVVVKNVKTFVEKFNGSTLLSEVSQLDKNQSDISDDLRDFIDAVKNNDLNDEYNLPNSKAERLSSLETSNFIRVALDALFKDGRIMTGTEYRGLSKTVRSILKNSLAGIYESSLGRQLLKGEKATLSAAITILLWQIQGKSFKELLGLRYSYLTNQKEQRRLRKQLRDDEISQAEYVEKIGNLNIEYSAIPFVLPNSSLNSTPPSRFSRGKVKDFNYDLMVYDTYDFLDKVISFSLTDVFVAAFDQFYKQTGDIRAYEMVNYFRFGTNDEVEIWLMRYGFSIEEAEVIKDFVSSINENEITLRMIFMMR